MPLGAMPGVDPASAQHRKKSFPESRLRYVVGLEVLCKCHGLFSRRNLASPNAKAMCTRR